MTNPYLDAIPSDYGRPVGVSPVGEGWTALWFEEEDGAIVFVFALPLGQTRDKLEKTTAG